MFDLKVLRRILGAVFDGGNWRRRYNDELMAMYGELDIIRLSRLRRIGHIGRMMSGRKVPQICFNQPEGKRKRGRPKNKWWDSVQEDIRKCGVKGWTRLVKDRGVWRKTLQEAKARIGLCSQK